MTRTTITGVRGTPLPNLEAHGLHRKMKPLVALIAEQDRLMERSNELGYEAQRLEEQIKQGEYEYTQEWGRAMRSSAGEEAPDEPIKRARTRLTEVSKEIAALKHAGELADAELKEAVAEHAAEYDALVQERGEKILSEAQEIAHTLTTKLAETEGLAALHGWLMSGARSYTPPMPASVSIDALVHERMKALGLLEAQPEVVQ